MVILGVLLAGFAFVLILSWWSEGYLGASEALLLFALYGGLIFGIFAAQTIVLKILVLIPLLFSAGWGGYALKMGSLRQYYLDQIKLYRRALEADPRNQSARRQLAETLYRVGDLDSAIAELKILIETSQVRTEERYLLKQWEEEHRMKNTGVAVCHHCGTENERGVNWCKRCEKPLLRYAQKSWLAEAGLKGFMVAFAALALTAISFVVLPFKFALIPIGCLAIAAAGWKVMVS